MGRVRTEEEKAARRAAYAASPQKILEANNRRREANREKVFLMKKRHREKHKEEIAASKKAHRSANLEREQKKDHERYLKRKEYVTAKTKAWRAANPERKKATSREHYMRNKLQARGVWLKVKYDLSNEEYDAMFKAQGGVCAICQKPPKKNYLAVDHCHDTGRVRALLCVRCNQMVGFVDNDLDGLFKAMEYVEKFQVQFETEEYDEGLDQSTYYERLAERYPNDRE